MGTDWMMLRHAHHKPLAVKFPEKCEWQIGFKPDIRECLVWYSDGSKTIKGTGTGVHRRGLRKRHSFCLVLHNAVFRPFRLVKWRRENRAIHYIGKNIYMLSASQVAIKTLEVSRQIPN
jgi:hypothetical protein